MAKSRLEPKKIVRYAESNVPRQGISGIPTPRIQRSTATVTATNAPTSELSNPAASAPAPASSTPPAPAPTPAPPAPEGETRSFLFNGATELTGSYSTIGGSRFNRAMLGGTFTPGWGQESTGSFTIFSVNDDTVADGFNYSWFFERISGSAGYVDYIGGQFSSGSGEGRVFMKSKRRLSSSPNFYSGSVSNRYIQAEVSAGMLTNLYENGNRIDTPVLIEYANASETAAAAYNIIPNSTDFSMSVGGPASGSSYYTGSIDNLAIAKFRLYEVTKTMPPKVEDMDVIDIVYKFEGNTLATKGGQDLEVVGTELYVSSSL